MINLDQSCKRHGYSFQLPSRSCQAWCLDEGFVFNAKIQFCRSSVRRSWESSLVKISCHGQQICLINSCLISPWALRYTFLMLSSHAPKIELKVYFRNSNYISRGWKIFVNFCFEIQLRELCCCFLEFSSKLLFLIRSILSEINFSEGASP